MRQKNKRTKGCASQNILSFCSSVLSLSLSRHLLTFAFYPDNREGIGRHFIGELLPYFHCAFHRYGIRVGRAPRKDGLLLYGLMSGQRRDFHIRFDRHREQVHQFHDKVAAFAVFHHGNAHAATHIMPPVIHRQRRGQVLISGILPVHLLHVIIHSGFHFCVVEVNQIRPPLRMPFLGQERSV